MDEDIYPLMRDGNSKRFHQGGRMQLEKTVELEFRDPKVPNSAEEAEYQDALFA